MLRDHFFLRLDGHVLQPLVEDAPSRMRPTHTSESEPRGAAARLRLGFLGHNPEQISRPDTVGSDLLDQFIDRLEALLAP
jgi:hypothetical protein